MKLQGFIGSAYTLDSVNVDAQRCVNLYPEIIESGSGKEGNVAYLRSTPGLEQILEVGDGPIRLIHVDSIGRIFVVSGNRLYRITNIDNMVFKVVPQSYETHDDIAQATDVDTGTDEITKTAHGYYTGLKVRVSSSNTLPTGLSSGTDYWVIRVDDDTFRLAASLADALASTDIDITGAGTGTMTVTPQIPAAATNINIVDDIDTDEDLITKASHSFYTGLHVKITTVGTSIPGGLAVETSYYVIAASTSQFQLASSISNASAGTEVDITAADAEEWEATLVGADGTASGTPVTLPTSTGSVKAASTSFTGDGTDSSTVFVDGVANLLFQDEAGVESFSVMGTVDVAEAVFNITDDVTVYTAEDIGDLIGRDLQILGTASGESPGFDATVFVDVTISNPTDPFIIWVKSTTGLTTAELVEFINTGAVVGKDVNLTGDAASQAVFNTFSAEGGGITLCSVDFAGLNGISDTFEADTRSGFGFGSVPTATDIVWIDGYFIVTEGGTNRFFVSDLGSFNINTLSFASAEGSPDLLLAVESNHRDLWLFGENTIEIYVNTGNADFPFERVQGGFLEVGCAAADSVAKIDGTLFWLGRSKEGRGMVFSAQGTKPQRISTHAIEQAIAGYADMSTASAYTYHSKGHSFYVLNFDEGTWVYDLATQMWHERAYTNNGDLERHRVNTLAFDPTLGLHIAGDYETNEVYLLKDDVYSDDGDEITRLRSCPHLSADMRRAFCSKFQLDMETGVGLVEGQGSDPQVMLRWSDNGGHTWSDESWTSAGGQVGGIGEYSTRVVWRRLGKFRNRIFEVSITDPVPVTLLGAHLEVSGGGH